MNKLSNYKLNIKGESDLNKFKRYIETGDRAKYYPTLSPFTSVIPLITLVGIELESVSRLKLGMKNGK